MTNDSMRLAYVTPYDAANVQKWSGLGYHIAQSLQQQSISVEFMGALREDYSLLFKAKQLAYRYFRNQRYLRDREPAILQGYARQIQTRLKQSNAEVVLSPGTVSIAYLDCQQPIVFWTDATFAAMLNFYPEFSQLCAESVRHGHAMEKAALERCSLAIYSSEWAAKSAINDYQISPSKVKVVPFGANIAGDRTEADIQAMVQARSTDQCHLLFLGVNWLRKGGDIALAVATQLNQAGLKTELTIVGCQPLIAEPLPNYVKSLGFISKSTAVGQQQFSQLLAQSHFLILPSRAECTPVVFSEANSFGVPCLSANIGGIPSIITDDLNGKLFAKEAVADYCNYITNVFTNYQRYQDLALTAFGEYRSRLNWSVSGQSVKKSLLSLMD